MNGVDRIDTGLGPIQAAFDREGAVVYLGFAEHEFRANLQRIPFGETRSYGQMAEALGDRNLSRAVGRVNGANPVSILVPCHRVIGAGGALTGYAGGLEMKERLLRLEGALPEALSGRV